MALEIPAAVRENLAARINQLRPLAPQARWVRAENLHVTLKFIGEVPAQNAGAIRTSLSSVRGEGPIELRFGGLSFFPDDKRPRVFWAGIEAGQALARLAGAIEHVLEPLGIAREQREFSAHLTLARFPQPGALPERFRATVPELAAIEFGAHSAGEFCLFESQLKPSGAQHTRVEAFPLGAEGS